MACRLVNVFILLQLTTVILICIVGDHVANGQKKKIQLPEALRKQQEKLKQAIRKITAGISEEAEKQINNLPSKARSESKLLLDEIRSIAKENGVEDAADEIEKDINDAIKCLDGTSKKVAPLAKQLLSKLTESMEGGKPSDTPKAKEEL